MVADARPLTFRGVAKSFGPIQALFPVDLEVRPGEFVTLLGPSGSGKTTLLNIAAGYIAPESGSVWIGDREVTSLPARKRNMGMVFQSYALFPHLTVFENVAYGLRVRRVREEELRRRVEAALAMVQLAGYGTRAVRQLSGGQQQRVALARALVIEPDVLLMDEPLGALDRQLRKHVQLEIRRLHRELARTTLYVTHDQEEALVMSDRIGVMSAGRIEQIGPPHELYRRPVNAFVASFLGESNLLRGRVTERRGKSVQLSIPDLEIDLWGAADSLAPGDEAVALLRPETIRLFANGSNSLPARIAEVVYLGELIAIRLALRTGQEFWCRCLSADAWPTDGSDVHLGWRDEDVRILPVF